MNLEECKNLLQNFLYREDFFTSKLLKGNRDLFISSFNIVLKHIENLENDEELIDYHKSDIKFSIEFLKEIILDEPISNDLRVFADNWCLFVYNWNNNVAKDKYINDVCLLLQRIIHQNISILESIDTLRYLNSKIRQNNSWNPPAFEIAKHFINYLEE